MDRRQQKTEQAIFSAFGALLARKSYNKITVNDIAVAANIGRSTFYAHFETKDELLQKMCDYLFRHIFETGSETGDHDFSDMPQTPEALITHILYHLRDRKRDLLPILALENADLFPYFSRTYLTRLAEFYAPFRDLPPDMRPPEDFILHHISSAFTGMLRWWIKNKLRQPPEQLAGYFTAVTGLTANN